jgi:hypothetical protein
MDCNIQADQFTLPEDGRTLLTGKPYVNAAQTDVSATFRRFGWTPPSEKHRHTHLLNFPPINKRFLEDWTDE